MDERDLPTIVSSYQGWIRVRWDCWGVKRCQRFLKTCGHREVSEKVSENLHILSNEPSLAMYRMQEHVRRTLPMLVEKKNEAAKLQAGLQGRHYDLENALRSVDSILKAATTFQRIHELCRSTMFHKQQLDYERTRRPELRPGMCHTDSNDSLVQELRKSKSLGTLKPRAGSASDLTSECGSVMSRSTLSTPMSESRPGDDDLEVWMSQRQFPQMSIDGSFEPHQKNNQPDDVSSTTTSGADSIHSIDSPEEEPSTSYKTK